MQITMVGAGYVGLVSAACLSDFGMNVVCVETDRNRLDRLLDEEIPFHEPELETLVRSNRADGRLRFTDKLENEIEDSDILFIAVGTPMSRLGRDADLSQVMAVADEIARSLPTDRVVVVATKSTVPVGTAREIESRIAALRPDLKSGESFHVASNPEFLREGSAIDDFRHPDRVVIGVTSDFASDLLTRLYRPISPRGVPIVVTDRETAELTKYATNGFLALKITYINEIASLCEKVGANIKDLETALGMDGRIGSKFLHPGPGYGGSCLPKDTEALGQIGSRYGQTLQLIETAIRVNTERVKSIADRVAETAGRPLQGAQVAILGLTFKPETSDLREAASLTVVPELIRRGARIRAYDPKAPDEAGARVEFAGMERANSALAAIENADVLLVLTEWNEFRGLSPVQIRELLAGNVVVDMRNIFDADAMKQAGLIYRRIGDLWIR